ncbi:alpha/beta-hydrolase [Peniophora sp. CONT]|nr:alpha/beta-hydrolase [Peniophora sp. CONT]
MESAAFRRSHTSRGIVYAYFYVPASQGHQTLLFLHGFPAFARIWHKQASFFRERGYGIVIPDMLGYGGTDKPSDPEAYVGTKVAKDITDIMDSLGLQKVVAIGHDWGCRVLSRLINLSPQRFEAFAFLGAGYQAPRGHFDLAATHTWTQQNLGRVLYGHWDFLASPEAQALIEKDLPGFASLMYPAHPGVTLQHVCPLGAMKQFLEEGHIATPPPYLTATERNRLVQQFQTHGVAGPLNWYKAMVHGHVAQDESSLPMTSFHFGQPVFYGACPAHPIYLPRFARDGFRAFAAGPLTVHEFEDAADWVMLTHADELNEALLAWVEDL